MQRHCARESCCVAGARSVWIPAHDVVLALRPWNVYIVFPPLVGKVVGLSSINSIFVLHTPSKCRQRIAWGGIPRPEYVSVTAAKIRVTCCLVVLTRNRGRGRGHGRGRGLGLSIGG